MMNGNLHLFSVFMAPASSSLGFIFLFHCFKKLSVHSGYLLSLWDKPCISSQLVLHRFTLLVVFSPCKSGFIFYILKVILHVIAKLIKFSSILLGFFFLFLKSWNLSSYTVVRNGSNSSCGYPVTQCYSSSPSFWYWRWCPYSILTFQVQLCLFLDFLFSPISLSIPALTLYSYNYRGLMVCFHIWQTSPPSMVPLFWGFLGYFFFPDKLCNQLAYP